MDTIIVRDKDDDEHFHIYQRDWCPTRSFHVATLNKEFLDIFGKDFMAKAQSMKPGDTKVVELEGWFRRNRS